MARGEDAEGVELLLGRSYPRLLAGAYDARTLALALPAMTRANLALLAGGTFFVAQTDDVTPALVGCGGWTRERPGTTIVEPGLGHLRHFACDPNHVRRGVARRIALACYEQAAAAGIERIECWSTRGAEPFYMSLGLRRVAERDVAMPRLGGSGATVAFPAIQMRGPLALP